MVPYNGTICDLRNYYQFVDPVDHFRSKTPIFTDQWSQHIKEIFHCPNFFHNMFMKHEFLVQDYPQISEVICEINFLIINNKSRGTILKLVHFFVKMTAKVFLLEMDRPCFVDHLTTNFR